MQTYTKWNLYTVDMTKYLIYFSENIIDTFDIRLNMFVYCLNCYENWIQLYTCIRMYNDIVISFKLIVVISVMIDLYIYVNIAILLHCSK